MRRNDRSSLWQVGIERWEPACDLALWVRAAERIPTPDGRLVPGPLAVEALPEPTTEVDPKELVDGWLAWWTAILTGGLVKTPEGRHVSGEYVALYTPELPGLTSWPELQAVARTRWREAKEWHESRRRSARLNHLYYMRPRIREPLQAALQRWGQSVGEIVTLTLLLLPVMDDVIRDVRDDVYLISERFYYDDPNFSEAMAAFVSARWG